MRKVNFVIIFLLIFLNSKSQLSTKTWLWKIEKKGIKYTSYLFGTFHEAGNSIFDSLLNAKKLLTNSQVLLVESDSDTASLSSITQEDVNKGYDIWMSKLNENQRNILLTYITKYNLAGYLAFPGSEILSNLHHDYISQFCSRHLKDTLFSMDYQIQLIAIKNSLNIKALDKIIGYDQIRIKQFAQIKTDTSVINEMITIMSDMLNLEKDREPCKILDNYINVREPYYFNTEVPDGPFSLNTRNNKWLEIIKMELRTNSCFIAVGFNHLRFKNGLIRKLQREGFNLTPIPMQ